VILAFDKVRAMDWEEFVKHPDIENTRRYLSVSPEKYL
jgi:hypothetical protein